MVSQAKLALSSVCSDGMVLQQNTEAVIWGTADAGAQVTVIPSWNGKSYKGKADSEGRWSVKVETPAGSYKAYTISVKGAGGSLKLNNVLIGEVWLASGRDQAQVIRSLIDNDFTPKTGVSATLKLISGGTLLPSVLAGAGPDVSLMEASTTIIDYALRNAVIPLNQFISTQENPADNVQLTEEEKEKFAPYYEKAKTDYENRWDFQGKEWEDLEKGREENYGIVPYEAAKKYVEAWLERQGK
mgnify:CR=1 FL=1